MSRTLIACLLCCLIVGGVIWANSAPASDTSPGVAVRFCDEDEQNLSDETDSPFQEASLRQPLPFLAPVPALEPDSPSAPTAAEATSLGLFGSRRIIVGSITSDRARLARGPGREIVLGRESKSRITSDAGSLLRKSPSALGVGGQKRSPIVVDPRIRGSRVGSLAASGSYWIPARMDLDTMVSKIDSRIVSDVIVVPGPYSVLYGPGHAFTDINLLSAPRYEDGWQGHGQTSFDFQGNGEQMYGRQSVWAGNDFLGIRAGYGHRTGNDYLSGNGTHIPASYNSREFNLVFGVELTPNTTLELTYLRLDQTDVEFPGQAFDIDFLATDAFDLTVRRAGEVYCDTFEVGTWYNRTSFDGSAQNLAKRQQFPFYDQINFVGFTDVLAISSGFRAAWGWGGDDTPRLSLGVDFRHLQQELNEFTSGRFGLAMWNNANSPIPESYSGNPGLYAEYEHPLTDRTRIRAGARGDSYQTNVTDDPNKLANLGIEMPQRSLAEILGSNQFKQHATLGACYFSVEHELTDRWIISSACGLSERPPNLTELYAAEPFMFLLQNGLNTVTGDPLLDPARRYQVDARVDYSAERLRFGARGYYALIEDHLTFEALNVFVGPSGDVEQVNLKFVNTPRAQLTGGECYAEYDWQEWLTPFATLQYVAGRDLTRNGNYATRRAAGGFASTQVAGLPRGFFSGLPGAAQEPLPGINPLETRLGLRFHQRTEDRRWSVELSARLVAKQDRVASSLLESPTGGFTVWNLRGYWRAFDDLMLVAGVENLFDRNYREHFDFRSPSGIQVFQPGANFYSGLELTY